MYFYINIKVVISYVYYIEKITIKIIYLYMIILLYFQNVILI